MIDSYLPHLVILVTNVLIVSPTPRCTLSGPNICTNHDHWRSDILCRSMGSLLPSGLRAADGYFKDTDVYGWDTPRQVKIKLQAREFFLKMNRDLSLNSWRDPTTALKVILKYEEQLNNVGQLLYGVHWHSHTGRCGLVDPVAFKFSSTCPCGDRGGDLVPCKGCSGFSHVQRGDVTNPSQGTTSSSSQVTSPGINQGTGQSQNQDVSTGSNQGTVTNQATGNNQGTDQVTGNNQVTGVNQVSGTNSLPGETETTNRENQNVDSAINSSIVTTKLTVRLDIPPFKVTNVTNEQ